MQLIPRSLVNLKAPPPAAPADESIELQVQVGRAFCRVAELTLPLGEGFSAAVVAAFTVAPPEAGPPQDLIEQLEVVLDEDRDYYSELPASEAVGDLLNRLGLGTTITVAQAALVVWTNAQPTAFEVHGWPPEAVEMAEDIQGGLDAGSALGELLPGPESRLNGRVVHGVLDDRGSVVVAEGLDDEGFLRCAWLPAEHRETPRLKLTRASEPPTSE